MALESSERPVRTPGPPNTVSGGGPRRASTSTKRTGASSSSSPATPGCRTTRSPGLPTSPPSTLPGPGARALRERGVIRGYHADVDPAALGRPLQGDDRGAGCSPTPAGHIRAFVAGRPPPATRVAETCSSWPARTTSCCTSPRASTEGLRVFVEDLSSNADVAYTETSLIFRARPRGGARPPVTSATPGSGAMDHKFTDGFSCAGQVLVYPPGLRR